jgi:predicted glycoside hydrolase/deacetylase ChbG (UPF0249 family)
LGKQNNFTIFLDVGKKLIPEIMKRNALIFFGTLFSQLLFAQSNEIRLIVRADDIGFSQACNEAIAMSYTQGIVTSVEVLAPSPWFPEAVRLLNEFPNVDVGVHLTLTSEWDNMKWRPLTKCKSATDSNGFFLPMVFPNANYPGMSVSEQSWSLPEIEDEFRAQIEMVKRNIPRVSHISGHMGCTDLSPEVRGMVNRLAKEYAIIFDLHQYNIQGFGLKKPSATGKEKTKRFIEELNRFEPGKTYLFVEHPGFDTPELRSLYHIGYEDVAIDRQGVTDLFTNKIVKKEIEKRGIKLIGYNDLIK